MVDYERLLSLTPRARGDQKGARDARRCALLSWRVLTRRGERADKIDGVFPTRMNLGVFKARVVGAKKGQCVCRSPEGQG